jgi:TolB protein
VNPTPDPSPTATAPPPSSRLGDIDLLSATGAIVGSVSIRESAPGVVELSIELVDQAAIHPWGIYDQPACGAPAVDRDAPFQFADIESGSRTEELEAAPYLAFASNLVLIVMRADGAPLYGCASLGGPSSPAASPTADDIACANPTPLGPPGTGRPELAYSAEVLSNADIYAMADDGSDVRRLTTALGLDIKPSWSPDGAQLAFRTVRDGQDEIYVMGADGTCQRNLTDDPGDDRSPAWSPDGRSIAFDHFFTGRFQDVALIDVSGGGLLRLSTGSGEYPAWSPDGSQVAFASARDGDYEVFVINADGSGEHRLTTNDAYDMYPAWSPVGAWIAYESDLAAPDLEIHVMRADGRDDRRLTTDDRNDRFPAWSRDGRLAWSSDGAIVVVESLVGPPIEIGRGQFPAWRP